MALNVIVKQLQENAILASVVSALIAAAIVAIWVMLWKTWQRQRTVLVSVERIVEEPWSVVLPGDLPDSSDFEASHPSMIDVYNWLRKRGAVDYQQTKLRLAIWNKSSEDVVLIRNIRVNVQRSKPVAGTWVHYPTAGANAVTMLMFDFDQHSPVAWEWEEDLGWQCVGVRPFFDDHNVTISKGDVHEFLIVGCTKHYLVQWRLIVDFKICNFSGTVLVNDSGKTFKTSGDPVNGFREKMDWAWYYGGRFLRQPE
jgi:hypothetical protein